jgi:cation transport regulator ChaB
MFQAQVLGGQIQSAQEYLQSAAVRRSGESRKGAARNVASLDNRYHKNDTKWHGGNRGGSFELVLLAQGPR